MFEDGSFTVIIGTAGVISGCLPFHPCWGTEETIMALAVLVGVGLVVIVFGLMACCGTSHSRG